MLAIELKNNVIFFAARLFFSTTKKMANVVGDNEQPFLRGTQKGLLKKKLIVFLSRWTSNVACSRLRDSRVHKIEKPRTTRK